MRSHDLDYRIIGDDIQLVEIELDPMETVIAEAGTMMYMDSGIRFETKMGDGSDPNQGMMSKLLSAGTRILTGESLFVTHFTNQEGGKQKVAFAAPYPGKIVPVELGSPGWITHRPERRISLCSQGYAHQHYPEQEDRNRPGGWGRFYPAEA